MEKRIIIDENKNAFALNGTKLEPLGKANELKNIWQQKVFTIGKNLYFKKGNEIFLLVENIDSIYEIEIDDFAWKQFELVGDVLVMVDTDMDGIKKLDKAYAPYLNWTIPCKEKPILFLKQEKEREKRNYRCQRDMFDCHKGLFDAVFKKPSIFQGWNRR